MDEITVSKFSMPCRAPPEMIYASDNGDISHEIVNINVGGKFSKGESWTSSGILECQSVGLNT